MKIGQPDPVFNMTPGCASPLTAETGRDALGDVSEVLAYCHDSRIDYGGPRRGRGVGKRSVRDNRQRAGPDPERRAPVGAER